MRLIPVHAFIAAHPRSRGEHTVCRYSGFIRPGSSPLARGTRMYGRIHYLARRLIPARAGNTVGGYAPGSLHRLIPARAGNTATLTTLGVEDSAHPRSRGEHCSSVTSARRHAGSSPLARGTRRAQLRFPPRARLIPARAGNTPSARTCSTCPPAHPRSRGEHRPTASAGTGSAGSSPLARGTHS